MKRVPGIEKMKTLNWEPKVKIEEGIKRTYDWYSKNLGKEELFYE